MNEVGVSARAADAILRAVPTQIVGTRTRWAKREDVYRLLRDFTTRPS